MNRWRIALGLGACACAALGIATWHDTRFAATSFHRLVSDAEVNQVVDRAGRPLSANYQNRWNTFDVLPLHQVPDFLKTAFLFSEDRDFYHHGGVDWHARGAALWQNIKAGKAVRGASTITEQVVRLITPRPRNLWSKWIETFEAAAIEHQFSKPDIFEFYLNQVPYASNRRGVVQAARFYFNRDLSTLNEKEMLALAVLARAPSSYDLFKGGAAIDKAIDRLAAQMAAEGVITSAQSEGIVDQVLTLEAAKPLDSTAHFIAYARQSAPVSGQIRTTLDSAVQRDVQGVIDERVAALKTRSVHNAAVLVADHESGEIVSYVVAGAGNAATPSNDIDSVRAPRQPGSALKPFLYATALDKGWTASTMLDDSPLSEAVGSGLHNFKNYSNSFYGKLSLREALANSLNIPALRTIRFVGVHDYLDVLHRLGIASLDRGADIYDEGLALGNGELSLFELVQAYAALAHRGAFRPLMAVASLHPRRSRQVFTEESASLIGNILSDPWARRLEFTNNSVLNLPVQTAAKTGTSSDYTDAWAVGYNDRYVVGIWMGNLDRTPTDGVTGSTGPALALRGIFARLNRDRETKPLFLSPKLARQDICVTAAQPCQMRSEFFAASAVPPVPEKPIWTLALSKPTEGLQIALDPRIPATNQKFEFVLAGVSKRETVSWRLNGFEIAQTKGGRYQWPVQRGHYTLEASLGVDRPTLPAVTFMVK